MEKGTRVSARTDFWVWTRKINRFTAWLDNSDKNPTNSDPIKTVRLGAQTFYEMRLEYVAYFVLGAKLGESTSLYDSRRAAASINALDGIGDAFFQPPKSNGDGIVTRDEVRAVLPDNSNAAAPVFDRLHTNKSGKLDKT